MRSHRTQRVGDLIKMEIGDIIDKQLKDPRIGFVTITGVEVSVDLRHAKVHFSVLGDARAKSRARSGLESARYFIQGQIGKRLRLRYTPELSFHLDRSIEYGIRIDNILRGLQKEDDREPEGGDSSP